MKFAFRFINGKPNINWEAVRQQIADKHGKSAITGKIFTFTLSVLREPKTYSQLGYFHAEIIRKWRIGLLEAGHQVPIGQAGEEYVKFQIKTLPEIAFVEYKENIITGEKRQVLRSLASASKEEMSHIIDVAIRIGSEYFGVTFESPEEFKKRRGLK